MKHFSRKLYVLFSVVALVALLCSCGTAIGADEEKTKTEGNPTSSVDKNTNTDVLPPENTEDKDGDTTIVDEGDAAAPIGKEPTGDSEEETPVEEVQPERVLPVAPLTNSVAEGQKPKAVEVSGVSAELPQEDSWLVWDFVNSCLDWHVPINREEVDSEWYFLRSIDAPNVIYTDWYVIQGTFTLPPTGSLIEKHTLSDAEREAFEKVVLPLGESRVVRDGVWELFLCEWDHFDALKDAGLGLWDEELYSKGNPRPFLVDGTGWPMEWLRREPYATYIQEENRLDLTSSWWDFWVYMKEYELEPTAGSPDPNLRITVTCTGDGDFRFDDNEGQVIDHFLWSWVLDACRDNLMKIEGVYDPVTDTSQW